MCSFTRNNHELGLGERAILFLNTLKWKGALFVYVSLEIPLKLESLRALLIYPSFPVKITKTSETALIINYLTIFLFQKMIFHLYFADFLLLWFKGKKYKQDQTCLVSNFVHKNKIHIYTIRFLRNCCFHFRKTLKWDTWKWEYKNLYNWN